MNQRITNVIMIAVTVAWLVPFYQIVTVGGAWVGEPSPVILALEVALFSLIIGYGIGNLAGLMRR